MIRIRVKRNTSMIQSAFLPKPQWLLSCFFSSKGSHLDQIPVFPHVRSYLHLELALARFLQTEFI